MQLRKKNIEGGNKYAVYIIKNVVLIVSKDRSTIPNNKSTYSWLKRGTTTYSLNVTATCTIANSVAKNAVFRCATYHSWTKHCAVAQTEAFSDHTLNIEMDTVH